MEAQLQTRATGVAAQLQTRAHRGAMQLQDRASSVPSLLKDHNSWRNDDALFVNVLPVQPLKRNDDALSLRKDADCSL